MLIKTECKQKTIRNTKEKKEIIKLCCSICSWFKFDANYKLHNSILVGKRFSANLSKKFANQTTISNALPFFFICWVQTKCFYWCVSSLLLLCDYVIYEGLQNWINTKTKKKKCQQINRLYLKLKIRAAFTISNPPRCISICLMHLYTIAHLWSHWQRIQFVMDIQFAYLIRTLQCNAITHIHI